MLDKKVKIEKLYKVLDNLEKENDFLIETNAPYEVKRISFAKIRKVHSILDKLEGIEREPDNFDERYDRLFKTILDKFDSLNREINIELKKLDTGIEECKDILLAKL